MKIKNIKYHILILSALFFLLGNSSLKAEALTATSTKYLKDKIESEQMSLPVMKAKGINRTLKRHSSGDDVVILQQFLKIYGVYGDNNVTGYFGSATEKAVKEFQKKEKIETLGMVGPKTREHIIAFSKEKLKETKIATSTVEISNVSLSSSVEDNGAPTVTTISNNFASTTPDIYAVISLKNTKQDTQLSYIRTKDGKYVDSLVSHPNRAGLSYFHFQWALKSGVSRSVGNYTVSFYVDGKKSKEVNFTIY